MSSDIHREKNSESILTIAFAINERFVEPFAVAFRSLAETNQALGLHVFIIYDVLSATHLEKIKKLAATYAIRTTFLEIDAKQVSKLKTGLHFDKTNYYRLYIPDLIQANKVLYLDSDILVKGDLTGIFNLNLGDNYIAAVPELISGWHPDLPLAVKHSYFNSGVMLINMRLWREQAIASKVIRFVEENPELVRFVDQCGLNVCLEDKWQRLPLKFNSQSKVYEQGGEMPDLLTKEELREAHDEPVIVHFTGTNKPWHMGNKHPYRWQYWQNLFQTPFRRYVPEDFSFLNVIKFLSPKKLKMKLRMIKLAVRNHIKSRQ